MPKSCCLVWWWFGYIQNYNSLILLETFNIINSNINKINTIYLNLKLFIHRLNIYCFGLFPQNGYMAINKTFVNKLTHDASNICMHICIAYMMIVFNEHIYTVFISWWRILISTHVLLLIWCHINFHFFGCFRFFYC